jgi:hypothetical protein
MIKIDFKHWKYQFSEEDLQHGSPNKKRVAKDMLRAALQNATLLQEDTINFTEDQIICANEAFPEAALADPLADMKIWSEWLSGVRIFPYPGEYSRLSITKQFSKKPSNSSTGVIGEIIAGIFGQALISPEVLVRVIDAWPDFIFYPIDNRYSFLEAKAFTQPLKITDKNKLGIPIGELGDGLIDAVQHLNFDPFVKMWYSFTAIQQIEPIAYFNTQFLELDVVQTRRDGRQPTVPNQVIDGLAERAIQKAFLNLTKRQYQSFFRKDAFGRMEVQKQLIYLAEQQIESVLVDIGINEAININKERKLIVKSINNQVDSIIIPEFSEIDEVLYLKSKEHQNDGSVFVRKLGLASLYKMELSIDERMKILQQWKANLKQANNPWKITDSDKNFWRCGSIAFALHYLNVNKNQ